MPATTMQRHDTTAAAVSPVKLSHVLFATRAMAPMRDWYRTVLAARVVFQNETLCFLTFDDEHHRIAILASPDAEARSERLQAGPHHIAFTYAGLGDLLHTYRRLKSEGIKPFWTINHGVTTSMYYRDPDHNGIELQVDNFATTTELTAFMTTGLVENPVGVTFDPDDMLRRYEAGVPPHELQRRPKLPPGTTPADMIRM
jgi:catechol-2,3-dioxygenase